MKKLLCLCIMLSVLLLFGCSDAATKPTDQVTEQPTAATSLPNDMQIVLPEIDATPASRRSEFQRANFDSFSIEEMLGNRYYGRITTYDSDQGNIDKDVLVEQSSSKATPLSYPANFPQWTIGSGSYIVLNNRFWYEWKSYTSEFSASDTHDMKLTRIDGSTGKVEVIDEVRQSSPFIYLCKIDEERFLSYYVIQAPSEKTEYATLTVAAVYSADGTKKEIIQERYENDESWTDSEGILIERFAIKDGEIYGFGRRRISGEYKFFLYHYDITGKLLDTELVLGFEQIIGNEQPLELFLVGDYIVFRTHESLSNFICKRNENGTELIMKGANGNTRYAISGAHIFFIERNYSDDEVLKNIECPLYSIDISNEKIKAVDFSVPLDNPYFVELKALSNGDLLFTYCDNGEYDPLKMIQYLLPNKEAAVLFEGG